MAIPRTCCGRCTLKGIRQIHNTATIFLFLDDLTRYLELLSALKLPKRLRCAVTGSHKKNFHGAARPWCQTTTNSTVELARVEGNTATVRSAGRRGADALADSRPRGQMTDSAIERAFSSAL